MNTPPWLADTLQRRELSELQLRGGTEDNSNITFLISLQDGSNNGSQDMFLWKMGKIIPK